MLISSYKRRVDFFGPPFALSKAVSSTTARDGLRTCERKMLKSNTIITIFGCGEKTLKRLKRKNEIIYKKGIDK